MALITKSRYFLIGFVLFLTGILTDKACAQEGIYKLHWTQNRIWTGEDNGTTYTKEFLHFEGAIYDAEGLPKYANSIRLQVKSDKEYSLKNIKYEPLPDSLGRNIEFPGTISNDKPRIKRFGAAGQSLFLDVNIQAIRIDPSTGKYLRLASFEIIPEDVSKVRPKTTSNKADYSSSLLATGYWYKFKVKESGIYKLTYADLAGMGLQKPADVRLFGYGGRQLSYWNSDPRPVDMAEIPHYMNKGSDGIFGDGDYILFYAEGPMSWDYDTSAAYFRQKLHGYSEEIFYFISDSHGSGKKITEVNHNSLTATHEVDEYDEYVAYEKERYNLVGSGRVWYSRRVDIDAFDTTFTIANLEAGDSLRIEAKMAGRTGATRAGYLDVYDERVRSVNYPKADITISYGRYAHDGYLRYNTEATGSQVKLGVSYNKVDQIDEAYLDYFNINARCGLKLSGSQTYFRDVNSIGEGNVARFSVRNASSSMQIWDITHINDISSMAGTLSGNTFTFKAPADTLRQYLAIDLNGSFPKPIIDSDKRGVGEVSNQNMRARPVANYIIIAPQVFTDQAERLANFHRHERDLEVIVVDPQKIYNEFSSGTPDITAIKDFLRLQYSKSDSVNCLKYLLLFGDGSYNNHIYKEGNTNYVPTYQSAESLHGASSYTSDDYYAMLDPEEGEIVGKMDIGVGRLPVRALDGTDFEAKGVVNKILGYHSSDYTDWRRRLVFVGDDGYDPGGASDGVRHMDNADEIATFVDAHYKGYEIRKVYLDAYPQVSSATGASYPDVNEELKNYFDKGLLIFTYFGHGSENQITGEIILQKSDLQTMKNKSALPLFITATCQFSRYDHVEIEEENNYLIEPLVSAGEAGVINPDGGAVAMLTTSRVVGSTYNVNLSLAVYDYLFENDANGKPYCLGEVIQLAKNDLPVAQINKLNFVLLGDPAMVLNYPRFQVCTDSINGIAIDEASDTLKAFSKVNVSGFVAYNDSSIIENFNGYVYPVVYDKESEITTFGNDNQDPYVYTDQKNLLYRGKATVTNGRFNFTFIVPKDIAYNIDKGKISYYAENGVVDAKGEFKDVYVGGTEDLLAPDNLGPEIALYMNNNRFEDGGITDANPRIYAELYDESGINTTGSGIGHDIVGIIDDKYHSPYVMNDYYEALADDFTRGTVSYPLSDLEDGDHYVNLKAWDVFNNSSEAWVNFVVISTGDMMVEKVVNYPNPTDYSTQFVYTHNASDMDHELILEIYDPMGKLVMREEYTQYESGFISTPLQVDIGSNLGSGIYPYRLQVTTELGTSVINNRLIIIR